MSIFGIIVFLVGVLGFVTFVFVFWYAFSIHDFGQNDWEEKDLKRVNKVETAKDGKKEKKKETRFENYKDGDDNNIHVVTIENQQASSNKMIVIDKAKEHKEIDENFKESDSGVGSDSPNLISSRISVADDDDDAQIDDIFLCRQRSAFSRISLNRTHETSNKMMLEKKNKMVNEWMTDVRKKNWDVEGWWKEIGVVALEKEGMSEENIIEFWESKMWFWGECKIMMEMLAGKVLELRREKEEREAKSQIRILNVRALEDNSEE